MRSIARVTALVVDVGDASSISSYLRSLRPASYHDASPKTLRACARALRRASYDLTVAASSLERRAHHLDEEGAERPMDPVTEPPEDAQP